MTELDTTTPSRELDAAVARALGHTVHTSKKTIYTRDNEIIPGWPYFYQNNSAIHLPNYSSGHKAGLLDCVLWLTRKGYVVECTETLWSVRDDYESATIVSVPGTDDAAFALCVCRAVAAIGEEALK